MFSSPYNEPGLVIFCVNKVPPPLRHPKVRRCVRLIQQSGIIWSINGENPPLAGERLESIRLGLLWWVGGT